MDNLDLPQPSAEVTKGDPQPWVDMDQLAANKRIIDDVFRKVRPSYRAGDYLCELMANASSPNPGEFTNFASVYRPEYADAISVVDFTDPSLNQVMNIEFHQPVFAVSDEGVYERLYHGIFHGVQTKNHGVALDGRFFNDPDWQKTQFILVKNNQEIAEHETRHAADPLQRIGFDRAVEEMFAYYKSHVLDLGDWTEYTRAICDPAYFKQYKSQAEMYGKWSPSQDEFEVHVRRAVNALHKMCDTLGDVETQRRLVQTHRLLDVQNMHDKVTEFKGYE